MREPRSSPGIGSPLLLLRVMDRKDVDDRMGDPSFDALPSWDDSPGECSSLRSPPPLSPSTTTAGRDELVLFAFDLPFLPAIAVVDAGYKKQCPSAARQALTPDSWLGRRWRGTPRGCSYAIKFSLGPFCFKSAARASRDGSRSLVKMCVSRKIVYLFTKAGRLQVCYEIHKKICQEGPFLLLTSFIDLEIYFAQSCARNDGCGTRDRER